MQTLLRGRHFLSDQEWTVEELETLLDVAHDLKRRFALGEPHRLLQDKTLFMIFFDKSTRTRNSFEAGMTQLGGHAHDLSPDKMQISAGETALDTAKVLSRYGHGIAVRFCNYREGHAYLREVSRHASIPVFNMQCDRYHPCQAVGDLMTIREKLGADLRGKKFVMSWAYGPAYMRPMSVPQSLIALMARLGMDVTLAHPPEFYLMPEIVEQARQNAAASGGKFEIVNDMDAAFEGAHVVYPKSWGCLEHLRDKKIKNPEQSSHIGEKYKSWICDERRMGHTSKGSLYMHCLPADRGFEVSNEVIDGPHSIVYDQAENRLHAQKALLALTMGGRP